MVSYVIIAACLINLENFKRIEATLNKRLNRQKRSVLKDESTKWPGGIVPYKFNNFDNGKEILAAEESMMRIQNQTCIRFIQATNETDYLLIERVKNFQPCLATVGYYEDRPHNMTFGNSCLERPIMIHKLMRVLGFLHEHQRVDRDNYILVNISNVQPGFESEFEKEDLNTSTTQGIPYDINSIMHYKNYEFSKHINSTTNIVPTGKDYMTMYFKIDYNIPLGSSNGLSPSDIKRISLRYNCSVPVEQSTTTIVQPTTALIKTSSANAAVITNDVTTTTPKDVMTTIKTSEVKITTSSSVMKTTTSYITTTTTTSYVTTETMTTKSGVTTAAVMSITSAVPSTLTTKTVVTTISPTKFSDLYWNNLWPSWLDNQKLTGIKSCSVFFRPSIISTFFVILSCTFLL